MQVRKLWSRKNSQIFVWPGEEPLAIAFSGESFLVPPRHQFARPGQGSPYRLEGARKANGDPLPGTIVVSDVVTETAGGGYATTLRVSDFCEYLVRDRDDLFKQGFNIVSSPDEVLTAMEMGLPLYEESQVERARAIIASELERRKKFEDKGQPAPPSSSEHLVLWAIAHLKKQDAKRPKHTADDLRAVLEGRYVAEAPPSTVPEQPTLSGLPLYNEARELGIQLTKTELQAILEGDESQMQFVRAKIQARRERRVEERIGDTVTAESTAG